VTAARELIADETVLREAENIPATKNPASPVDDEVQEYKYYYYYM